ncbi:MAG TPA: hypothetical protein VFF68_07190 [Anaerolineaceae bacterium]|nr:hypothetical protein [Anaerolineaceae bacterium]
MVQHTIDDFENKWLWVEVKGDLELVGSEENRVTIEVDHDQFLRVIASPDRITIHCERDMQISAPDGASIHVTKAHRDASVRDFSGRLEIDGVGGDLAVVGAAALKVLRVGGDCSVQAVSGPVRIDSVGGDFFGRDLAADVKVDRVGSDFSLLGATESVTATAGGDIHLGVSQTGGQSVDLRAGGDARVSLPPDPDVTIRATSGGQSVRIDLAGVSEEREMGVFEDSYGSGEMRLEVAAGGDVILSDGPVDQSKEARKRTQWEDRAARKTAKALRKAEEKLAKAERQAEERVQAAMRRLEASRLGRQGVVTGTPPAGTSPAADEPAGVTEEEKLIVLKMLQEKKITVEEADRLLAALEGRPE